MISVRLLLSLAIACVAIIAACVAFIPTYIAGTDGVRGALVDLRRAYVGRADSQVNAFFEKPITMLRANAAWITKKSPSSTTLVMSTLMS